MLSIVCVLGCLLGLTATGEPQWESITNVNSAQAVALHGDTVWVGSMGGLVEWDVVSGTSRVHLASEGFSDNSVAAVVVDAVGRPWIGLGTWNGGVAVLDSGAWTTWTSEDGLASDWVTCIAIDTMGRKWVGTVRGVSVLDEAATPSDKSDDRVLAFGTADGLIHQDVNAISVDLGGRVWIATSSGLSVLDPAQTPFDKSDDAWARFTAADGLLADAAYGVSVDEAGRVWVGARGGVSVLDFGGTPFDFTDDVWTHYGSDQGLSAKADYLGIAFCHGSAWMACSRGLVALEGALTPLDPSDDKLTTFAAADGLLKSYVRAIALDDAGIVWCAVLSGGLDRLDAGGTPSDKSDDSWTPYVVDGWLPGADIRAVLAEADITWVGSSSGLVAYADGQFAHFSVGVPLAMQRDGSGVLWIGTTGGLVALADGATPFDSNDDHVTYFSSDDGLPVSYVQGVSIDAAGRVWAATSAGISILDSAATPHEKSDDQWMTFAVADGLAGDRANAIAAEGDRRVWVVHESYSISALDHGGTPFDKSDDAWVVFGDGSPVGACSGYAVTVDPAGIKWFGLCPGLFALDDNGTLSDLSDDRWQRFDIGDCNPGVALDELGRVWVATGWSGVAMLDDGGTPFDVSDDAVTGYRVLDGLVDDRAQVIAVKAGVIWIGTDGGLSRLVP